MEGLLILVGIYVLEVVIKKLASGKNNKQSEQPKQERRTFSNEEPKESKAPRSLQDLIRQFEEAQQESAQGTYVPPTPPVDTVDEGNEDFPVVKPATPGEFTFTEIAESVVQWEIVNIQLLQEAFGFSEEVSRQVLHELQAKRIVGRDMGDGYCDLLIHDKSELNNLFNRLQQEAEAQQAAAAQEAKLHERREAELKHQKELAELEERAKQLREQANQLENLPEIGESTAEPCLADASHKSHKRTFDRAEIRRGFIWAKVLDEPRFKKRWSARAR